MGTKYIHYNQIQECGSLFPPDELLLQYKLGSVTWDGLKKEIEILSNSSLKF